MAKRNPYSRNRNSNNGRILTLLALLGLLVVVIWLTRSSPAPEINKDNLDQAMLDQQQATNGQPAVSSGAAGSTEKQTETVGPQQLTASEPPATVAETQKTSEDPHKTTAEQRKSTITPSKDPVKPPPAQFVREQSAPPSTTPKSQAETMFAAGKAAFDAINYLKARDNLSDAVRMGLNPEQDRQARQMLNAATDQWLFTRSVFEQDEFCRLHKVASGEILANIGKKYDIPYELIMRINNIKNPLTLGADQTIKVVQGPFHALVELSKFQLSVFLGDVLVRTYTISIGKPGRETPTGLWRVTVKQPNPSWTDPDTNKHYLPNDPDNPLGERWIGLEGLEGDAVGRTGIGLHGTIAPDDIGMANSRGCIRLYNGDVRELYDLLIINKSLVRVVE